MASPQDMKLLPSTSGGRILHNPVSLQPTHVPLGKTFFWERGLRVLTSTPWKATTDPQKPIVWKKDFSFSGYRDLRYPIVLTPEHVPVFFF